MPRSTVCSIAVHEFRHTIDGTLRSIDPAWTERRNPVFRDAMATGLECHPS